MAPEQAQSQPVSGRTDLYALGVIAFELLTGQRPFEADSPLETAMAHVQQQPPKPSDFVPVSREVDALVLRLLEKDPARRPADAAAVRREVKELAQRLGAVTKIGKAPEPPDPFDVEPTKKRPAAGEAERTELRDAAALAPPTRVVRRRRSWVPWVALAVVGLAGGAAWSVMSAPGTANPTPGAAPIASGPGTAAAPPTDVPMVRASAPGTTPAGQLADAPGAHPLAPGTAPVGQPADAPGAHPSAPGSNPTPEPLLARDSTAPVAAPEAPVAQALPAPPSKATAGPTTRPAPVETDAKLVPPMRRTPPRATTPPPVEPTKDELLKRIGSLKRRVEASALPGGSPNPMILTLLSRQEEAARAAPDGPARAKVARSLDLFEEQFEKSGDLKPR